ncbi:MAG: hypothetical protein LJF04_01720 [Gemmatimonadetes bacterium]|nr:hypothetical protein [Gemmatimonadota bacterium]
MRSRSRVLQSLEGVYREAFEDARSRDDKPAMASLELEYQRDQIQLEVLLDIRDLLSAPVAEEKGSSLLEKAQALRQITKLR